MFHFDSDCSNQYGNMHSAMYAMQNAHVTLVRHIVLTSRNTKGQHRQRTIEQRIGAGTTDWCRTSMIDGNWIVDFP